MNLDSQLAKLAYVGQSHLWDRFEQYGQPLVDDEEYYSEAVEVGFIDTDTALLGL